MSRFNPKGLPLPAECTDNGLALTVWEAKYKNAIEERDAALGRAGEWRRIDGPGIDGQRVMLRELDPFDRFNRGDENRDAIASGYWSAEHGHYVWPFGCTDHPPTHWAPMPARLTDESKEGGA